MIRLAADENFNGVIVGAVLGRQPDLDVAGVRDAGLAGADDPTVLEWTAREGRVLLTHDARTMPRFAHERVHRGLAMPGVFVIRLDVAVGRAVADILILATCSREGEWEGQVRYLPL